MVPLAPRYLGTAAGELWGPIHLSHPVSMAEASFKDVPEIFEVCCPFLFMLYVTNCLTVG